MAISQSIFSKATGKLGATVLSINSGVQIVREYQPNVTNPNTVAQVNQRARMKLMSQLAASLAQVIVIPKNGLKSARNQFVAKNFSLSSAIDGVASITIENVQLTNGNAGLPNIVANRSEESGVTIQLGDDASAAVDQVVYMMYTKTSESTLQYMASTVVTAAGAAGTFPATLPYVAGDIVIFAYGMKAITSKAAASYGNMVAESAVDVATLVGKRTISYNDYQFTETRGATMYEGETEIADVPEGYARVFVTSSGNGTVSGAGVFEKGTNVTVKAVPNDNYGFAGWRKNGTTTPYISQNEEYTFELNGTVDLVADFNKLATTYNVTAEVDPLGSITSTVTVTGSGDYPEGEQATVTTSCSSTGAEFVGWFVDNSSTAVSTSRTYTFIPTGNTTIRARWNGAGGD